MNNRIGSLFSGYGGLEMGINPILNATTAWHVEHDKAPSKILHHHWPEITNHGDITSIDWATVEPVDILCGGFPCQDVSLAGLRKGLHPNTRSGLWSHFALAIDALRPQLVIVENVRGLLSSPANSNLEPDAWDMGDGDFRPPLRALGAILGDLADLGFDAEWASLRAADAGAPHGRFRVFLIAYPKGSRRERWNLPDASSTQHGQSGNQNRPHPSQNPHVATRDQRGLTTPRTPESRRPRADVGGRDRTPHPCHAWGIYAEAVHQWEIITGRTAPNPHTRGRLSAAAVEWMMGLPAGHVTDVSLSRSEQLKALGNGVVPQQAALALTHLLSRQGTFA